MNYIRTKDGIWKYDQENNFAERPNKDFKCTQLKLRIKQEDIIKQADTIEELCDEFVVIYKNNEKFKKPFTSVYDNLEDLLKEHDINECKVYGAIWAKNGLIYVAKVNEKGELELI